MQTDGPKERKSDGLYYKKRIAKFAGQATLMPVVFEKNINDNIQVAVWHIIEDETWLRHHLGEINEAHLEKMPASSRRREWLASRILLCKELGEEGWQNMEKTKTGKPFLSGNNPHISISHSRDFATVALSAKEPVGVDIEQNRQQIERIKHKFMSEQELTNIDEVAYQSALHLHWCAKETVFKIYGKGGVDFKEHICIKPFSLEKEGRIEVAFRKHNDTTEVNLHYILKNSFFLVFGAGEL